MENKLDREIEKKRLKKCNIRKKNEKKNTQPTNNNSKNVKGNIPLWKKKKGDEMRKLWKSKELWKETRKEIWERDREED